MRNKAAWLMKHKLLQVQYLREQTRQLDGRAEVDDAYLGGWLPGGKAGRGSENKVSFIAAVQTNASGHPEAAFERQQEADSVSSRTAAARRPDFNVGWRMSWSR